jgi:hypothetical protein
MVEDIEAVWDLGFVPALYPVSITASYIPVLI